MPRAVQEYVDTKDFLRVFTVQKTLNDSYIADMAKYASPSETSRTMAAWASLPAQLAKKNKKFQYQVIGSGARAYNYAPSIDWLRAAGMINKCILTREGRLPLSAFTDPTAFKLYMVDTGLLCSKFGIPANAVLSASHDLDAFKGALAENYVMQALTANGLEPYYWTSGAQAELDFVFQNAAGQIIPLEVKAADNVRARSLGIFLEKYAVPYAYRVSARNFGCEGSLRSVPLYAVFCITE
jgi:predicted AAA+ superfamily ATPase